MVIDDDLLHAARRFAREALSRGFVLEAVHPYTDVNGNPLH